MESIVKRKDVLGIVRSEVEEFGIVDYKVIFSKKEFKKESSRYI